MAKSSNPDPRMDPDAKAVERLLRQLQQKNGSSDSPPPRPVMEPRRVSPAARRDQPRPARLSLPSVPGVWARVALGAVLGVALTQWPYPAACGTGLGLKIAATAVVAVAGIWAAGKSWRRRMGAAHVTALLVLAWGLALLTHQVIPHTRYWPAPVPWLCTPATPDTHTAPAPWTGELPPPEPPHRFLPQL